MKRTKIVCTLGPACADLLTLRAMANAGMDVVRLNFSHGSHQSHAEHIARVRAVEVELDRPISILQDLCGPKLRLGELPPEGVVLRTGESCMLASSGFAGGECPRLPVPLPELLTALQTGGTVFLDDAQIELQVVGRSDDDVRCEIRAGGRLFSRKGISAPGAAFQIAALTPQDMADMEFGLAAGVDYIAASFVRRAADLDPIRTAIRRIGAATRVIAKVEKPEAIDALDEIVSASDGLMAARGDLGVEMPWFQVPVLQKQIIAACNAAGKPVITATQLLESMIQNPRPTRAEASDIANAIYDGTSAVMLSGETASGRFPVEAVATMTAVAEYTEGHLPYERMLQEAAGLHRSTRTEAVSHGVAEIAHDLNVAAILCGTSSGETARQFSRLRPRMPIIAATANDATYHRLPLLWGVRPLRVEAIAGTDERIAAMIAGARSAGWITAGQTVVIAFGAVAGIPGGTNTFRVETV